MDTETKLNRTKYLIFKIHTYLKEYDDKLSSDNAASNRPPITLSKLYSYIQELYSIWDIVLPTQPCNSSKKLSVGTLGTIRRWICDIIDRYNPLANTAVILENVQADVEDFLDRSCVMFGFLQVIDKLRRITASQLSTPTSHSDASSDQE